MSPYYGLSPIMIITIPPLSPPLLILTRAPSRIVPSKTIFLFPNFTFFFFLFFP